MRNGIVENWRRGHSEKPTVPAAPSVFVIDDEVGDVGGAVAPHAAHIKGIERLGILHHEVKSSGFAQSLGIERDFEFGGAHGAKRRGTSGHARHTASDQAVWRPVRGR